MSCLLTFVRPKTILANDRGNPCDRPRTNEAHAAADGVDQLRKLVQAGPAKKTPDVRSAQVVLHLDERVAVLHLTHVRGVETAALRIGRHPPKREGVKHRALVTGALLTEEDRTSGVDLDRESDQRHQRGAGKGAHVPDEGVCCTESSEQRDRVDHQ